ncbi:MAG: ZPR1 zinc finger domain-containing protein [Candidatus Methanomethyliaceae archaeon]|nr:ZPR1 zinc finger domain-containing protein [Candidatus Methanomethyliaceae archaeon]
MDEDRKETSYKVTCASCGKKTLNVKEVYYHIPNFGRTVMVSMLCSKCGYRVSDIVSLEHKGPAKLEFQVKSPKDLKARIVRSTTSTLTIPELGLELKPGPRSEAFITNVEGVLDRFSGIAEQLMRSSEDKSKEKSKIVLRRIRSAIDGKIPFKVIIDDEFGNSIIIPPEGMRD